MKKKISIIVGSLILVLVLVGAIGASVAYAQDDTPPTPFDGRGPKDGHGLRGAVLGAAADALDMTTDELKSALQGGQTLEQIADQAGVDIETVKSAMDAARDEEIRARIEQGLADGALSQEKADWLLEGLEKGFLDGPGFGFGARGPHGPGPDGQPDDQPAPPSS